MNQKMVKIVSIILIAALLISALSVIVYYVI